jgi:oligopeptide/dipeptide ABC transporter ATP-binding protein
VNEPLLRVEELRHVYRTPAGRVYAVDGVSFAVGAGETVGLVGESGSGKSTVARCLVRLLEPSGGRVVFAGREISRLGEGELRPLRARLQMVFQDPTLSLNPRLTVRQTLSEPLRVHRIAVNSDLDRHLGELMDLVNLDRALLGRRPGALSGGQRQRVGIARAIATRPDFVVLDEPTSSLDLSIRSQIISLLRRLQRELGMAYLFISHDLTTVRTLCSRVIVMYLGQIVEEGPVESIFADPKHPYTQALLSAAPVADPRRRHERRRIVLPGETPSLHAPVVGCPLADRCPYVEPSHRVGRMPLFEVGGGGHRVACVLYRDGAEARAEEAGMRENGRRP